MTFADYYRLRFRDDLTRVIRSAPPPHHLSVGETEVRLQPRTLSDHNETVRSWPAEQRALFGVALFFSVLVDQVCYTYHRNQYEDFRRLTQYPKFVGDCPGGCYSHLHPSLILEQLGGCAGMGYAHPPVPITQVLASAIPVMRREVLEFCRDHMPMLNGSAFWAQCLDEIPRWSGDTSAV